MDLAIKKSEHDNHFLARSKATLLANFKLSNANQVHQAALVANYLVALDRYQEATELLESYVPLLKFQSDRQDIWSLGGQGVVLLSYLYQKRGDSEKAEELLDTIRKEDIIEGGLAEFFAEELEDHDERMQYAASESQKYQCEVISQQILSFLYLLLRFPEFSNDVGDDKRLVIEEIVSEGYETLCDAINSK